MADAVIGPPLRQAGPAPVAPQLDAGGEAGLRPQVVRGARPACEPRAGTLAPAWLDDAGVGTLHAPSGASDRSAAVELMAGARRMAHAFANAGSWAVSFEIADAPRQDVLNTRNRRWLQSLVKTGYCRMVWVGLGCASWSLARRNVSGKPGFPPPLRDPGQYIWGLPNLSEADRERVKAGSKQLRWAVSLFTPLAANNVPCIIENPLSSRVWKAPPMRRLLARFPSVELHFGRFPYFQSSNSQFESFNSEQIN